MRVLIRNGRRRLPGLPGKVAIRFTAFSLSRQAKVGNIKRKNKKRDNKKPDGKGKFPSVRLHFLYPARYLPGSVSPPNRFGIHILTVAVGGFHFRIRRGIAVSVRTA